MRPSLIIHKHPLNGRYIASICETSSLNNVKKATDIALVRGREILQNTEEWEFSLTIIV
jgi:hypothetical protein